MLGWLLLLVWMVLGLALALDSIFHVLAARSSRPTA